MSEHRAQLLPFRLGGRWLQKMTVTVLLQTQALYSLTDVDCCFTIRSLAFKLHHNLLNMIYEIDQ